LSNEEEKRICKEFYNYVKTIIEVNNAKNSYRLYHWSSAEIVMWKNSTERYFRRHERFAPLTKKDMVEDFVEDESEWCDLLKIFHYEPIVIKGCLDFSLKTIAKKMAEYGFIKSKWDEKILNGMSTLMFAYNCNEKYKRTGTHFKDMREMTEVIRYNEVDCKVLYEIVLYLRKTHI
jgi:hypothetical protein